LRRIQAQKMSSFDDYEIVETPVPTPGEGQAVVRVAACGVGYVEALTALGGYQLKAPLPFTPGGEVSGTVSAVGPGVTGLKVGDRVMTYLAGGGMTEYGLAPAASLTVIPKALSFEQAAAGRTNMGTVLHALKDRARIQPGERLLVIGAAGGVGVAAVQVGRLMGVEVIAVASSEEKRAFALEHGAHAAIDTEVEGWRDRLKVITGGKGVDVVLDPVCGPLFELAFRSLAWNGRHLVVGFVGGIPELKANLTLMKGAALMGVDIRQFGIFEPEKSRANGEQVLDWLESGVISPPVGRVFPFEDYRLCMAFALSGKNLGKTVLSMRPVEGGSGAGLARRL
jgi:NADPH:quinone reductase